MTTATTTEQGRATQRPLQIVSWDEKNKNRQQWFREYMDYYIGKARFDRTTAGKITLSQLYEVYNNQFPSHWFDHITNPLSATKERYKKFPARLRPTAILRPNLDLLMSEFPRRPFVYNVENLSDAAYNRYQLKMKEMAQGAMTEEFIRGILEERQAAGEALSEEEIAKLQQEPPLPEQLKQDFVASYGDAVAYKSQRWLRRQLRQHRIRAKLLKGFKHWLIAGQVYTYKDIINEQLVYEDVNPLDFDFGMSKEEEFVENGEWCVRRKYLTLSDVVDQFYDVLSKQEHDELEQRYIYGSPTTFHDHLKKTINQDVWDQIPVYHVQWKARKPTKILKYLDMETFQMVEEPVDENYIADESKGETIEMIYPNEVYEGWKIGSTIYANMRAKPVQRNELNNISKCKLSYNGRKYSDTNADEISVMEIGIPFQITYIIIQYILEKTIAKSKGKIVMMDQNTIPDNEDWDEDKFFYYAEGMGYALIDRSQPGVDKTWNQYQVLDLSLFEQISQLIELQQHVKQEWDDIIGINRQRKGQTYASDGQGVNERAAFQSTVMTDMIFLGFEEFCQQELQGILDLGKYLTAGGLNTLFTNDEYLTELLEIAPGELMEDLGVFIENSSEIINKLQQMKAHAQALLQNDHKPSTVLEIIDSINIAELRTKLRRIEQIDAEIEQQLAASQEEAEAAADARQKDFMHFQELLRRETMHEEYQEKQDLEMIKIAGNIQSFGDGDTNDNGVPDIAELEKLRQNNWKLQEDARQKTEDRKLKVAKLKQDQQKLEHTMKNDKEKNQIARKKAAQRPKTSKK